MIFGWDEREFHANLGYFLVVQMFFGALCLLFITAPYGRFSRDGWGFMINARVAWILQEAPCLVMVALCLSIAEQTLPWANIMLTGMFALHYFNRTLIFPFLIRGGKPTPVFTFLCALLFCTQNGYLMAREVTHMSILPADHHTTPLFVLGSSLFFIGFGINWQSDSILRNLRKPGETGYKIPKGGMYDYVSAANYFGELVEWFGFALACGTLTPWFFFVNTAFNLAPRARQYHNWYLEKFEDYPKERKILIPFVL